MDLTSWVSDALGGSMALAVPVALLAGVVSFFSPCVVPLLPGYLSYMTGVGAADLAAGHRRGRMLLGTVLFVLNLGLNEGTAVRGGVLGFAYALGLCIPFVVAGVAFGAMTRTVGFLRRHQVAVMRIGGLMMVAVGLLLVTGLWDQLMARLTVWVG